MPKIQQYTSDLGIIIHTATIHTEETGETIFCLYIQHMYICIFIVHIRYICCKHLYCSSLLVGQRLNLYASIIITSAIMLHSMYRYSIAFQYAYINQVALVSTHHECISSRRSILRKYQNLLISTYLNLKRGCQQNYLKQS